MFPFARFPGVDTVLGPEMRSTGEVMGIDRALRQWPSPRASSAAAPACRAPGTVFVSVREADKPGVVAPLGACIELGFKIMATGGTQRFLAAHGVPAEKVNKVSEGRPHAVDAISNGGVQLVFNTTEGATSLAEFQAAAARCPLAKNAVLHHSCRAPSPRSRASGPIRRAILKCARCRTISPDPAPAALATAMLSNSEEQDLAHGKVSDDGRRSSPRWRPSSSAASRSSVRASSQAIAEARAHGDLSENAEYHSAKEAQSHNEGRIVELEDKLQRAEVIDVSSSRARRSSSARR